MTEFIDELRKCRLMPIIKHADASDALMLCSTIAKGGLRLVEITFGTDQSEEAIRRISMAMPDILLGAGMVGSVEQVKRAVFAGASFISSPGFIPGVVEYCLKNGITVLPAICTPTELAHAGEYGLSLVKFFPAEQAGGLPMLKLLAAPFDSIEYIPTGGVSPGNVADYLSFDKVAACGGSWMLKDELIMEGRYKEILKLVRHAVRLTALKPAVQKLSS